MINIDQIGVENYHNFRKELQKMTELHKNGLLFKIS